MPKKPAPTISDLFPGLTEQELKKSEETLERYLAIVLRIFERIELAKTEKVDPLTPPNGTLSYIPQESESPQQSS